MEEKERLLEDRRVLAEHFESVVGHGVRGHAFNLEEHERELIVNCTKPSNVSSGRGEVCISPPADA
jgi:hypothetical protein